MGCTESKPQPKPHGAQPQRPHRVHDPLLTPDPSPQHGGGGYPSAPAGHEDGLYTPPHRDQQHPPGRPPSYPPPQPHPVAYAPSPYAPNQPAAYTPPPNQPAAYTPPPPQAHPPATSPHVSPQHEQEEVRQIAEAIRRSQEDQRTPATSPPHHPPSPYESPAPVAPPAMQLAAKAPAPHGSGRPQQASIEQLQEMYPRLDRSAIQAVYEAKQGDQEQLHTALAELCQALPQPSGDVRCWDVNDTVDAMFQGAWYPAVVMRREPNGDFVVRWIEDDTQTIVTFDQIRPIRD